MCRSAKETPKQSAALSNANSSLMNAAVLFGALLPDVSLFIMWGQAKVRGIADDVIWRELYYSVYWQEIGAITNSIPLYALIMVVGLMFGGRLWLSGTDNAIANNFGLGLMLLATAALTHCLTDLPLHVDDGHAHFWPISRWIFTSPVSYWDVNHYASYWQPVELVIAVICAGALYRRFESSWGRAAVIISLLSYAAMVAFWTYSLGLHE